MENEKPKRKRENILSVYLTEVLNKDFSKVSKYYDIPKSALARSALRIFVKEELNRIDKKEEK